MISRYTVITKQEILHTDNVAGLDFLHQCGYKKSQHPKAKI